MSTHLLPPIAALVMDYLQRHFHMGNINYINKNYEYLHILVYIEVAAKQIFPVSWRLRITYVESLELNLLAL